MDEDLIPLMDQARRLWKKNHPAFFKSLKREGRLDVALEECAEAALTEYGNLVDSGMHPSEAKEVAWREWIFNPPGSEEDDDDESAPSPQVPNDLMPQATEERDVRPVSTILREGESLQELLERLEQEGNPVVSIRVVNRPALDD